MIFSLASAMCPPLLLGVVLRVVDSGTRMTGHDRVLPDVVRHVDTVEARLFRSLGDVHEDPAESLRSSGPNNAQTFSAGFRQPRITECSLSAPYRMVRGGRRLTSSHRPTLSLALVHEEPESSRNPPLGKNVSLQAGRIRP